MSDFFHNLEIVQKYKLMIENMALWYDGFKYVLEVCCGNFSFLTFIFELPYRIKYHV